MKKILFEEIKKALNRRTKAKKELELKVNKLEEDCKELMKNKIILYRNNFFFTREAEISNKVINVECFESKTNNSQGWNLLYLPDIDEFKFFELTEQLPDISFHLKDKTFNELYEYLDKGKYNKNLLSAIQSWSYRIINNEIKLSLNNKDFNKFFNNKIKDRNNLNKLKEKLEKLNLLEIKIKSLEIDKIKVTNIKFGYLDKHIQES